MWVPFSPKKERNSGNALSLDRPDSGAPGPAPDGLSRFLPGLPSASGGGVGGGMAGRRSSPTGARPFGPMDRLAGHGSILDTELAAW